MANVQQIRLVFYGWWLVAVAALIMAVAFGPIVHGAGVFMVALRREFGWSQWVLSVPFSLNRAAEGALLGPVEGYLTDRVGTRWMVLIGLIVLGIGFVMLSFANSILGYYVAVAIAWAGAGLAGFIPLMTAINNWFIRRRATAMAIGQAGVNLGGLLVPGIAWAVTATGWRNTALWFGIATLAVALPLSWFLRNRPEEYGLRPDGGNGTEARAVGQGLSPDHEETDNSFTAWQAVRTRAFWAISFAHGFAAAAALTLILYIVPSLVHSGMSIEKASVVVTTYTLTAVLAQLAGGVVGDRFPKHLTIAALIAIQATGGLIAVFAQSLPGALLFAVLFGIGYGGRNPILVAIRGDYFGRKHFGAILGVGSVPTNVMAVSPIIAGYYFDSLGSFTVPFVVLAFVTFLGSFLALLATKPQQPLAPSRNR